MLSSLFKNISSEPLPPPVADLLANPEQVKTRYPLGRGPRWRTSRAWARPGDNPSAAFYRMYEFLVVGWTVALRNEFEYFCVAHPDWAVADLPDPADERDPARYAVLAGLTELMCESFNRRVEHGLPRDAPAIVEDWEELARRPKVFEKVPEWAKKVEPLAEVLRIPDHEGALVEADDPEVCEPLKKLNVLVRHPHIHFV